MKPIVLKEIGRDAKNNSRKTLEEEKKELIIMVVGEAARADRFSFKWLLKRDPLY